MTAPGLPGWSSALSSVLCRPGNQAATPHPKSGVAAAFTQPCRPRILGGTPATARQFCRCRSSALSSVLCRPGNQAATPPPEAKGSCRSPTTVLSSESQNGTPATVGRFCRAGQETPSPACRVGPAVRRSLPSMELAAVLVAPRRVALSRVPRFVLQKHGSCSRWGRKSTGSQDRNRPPTVAVNSVAPTACSRYLLPRMTAAAGPDP